MKIHRLLLGVGLSVWLPVTVMGQGVVRFSNIPTDFLTSADRYVYEGVVGGTRLVGTHFMAQLYAGTTADSLTAVGLPASFRMVPTTAPGTWIPANVNLPAFAPGATVTMQVRVWDSTYGAVYEDAGAGSRGASAPFSFVMPLNDMSPNTLEGLRAFAVVPEPGSIALGALGLLVVLGSGRRKQKQDGRGE